MSNGPNWARLLVQNRCKAIGVSWSEAELHAIHQLKVPADFVRRGCLTIAEYEAMQAKDQTTKEDTGEAPLASLTKKELVSLAGKLGIDATDDATKSELIDLIEIAREKSAGAVGNTNEHGTK